MWPERSIESSKPRVDCCSFCCVCVSLIFYLFVCLFMIVFCDVIVLTDISLFYSRAREGLCLCLWCCCCALINHGALLDVKPCRQDASN